MGLCLLRCAAHPKSKEANCIALHWMKGCCGAVAPGTGGEHQCSPPAQVENGGEWWRHINSGLCTPPPEQPLDSSVSSRSYINGLFSKKNQNFTGNLGKKNKVKNITKLGRRRARAQKRLNFLTKIVENLSKIDQKMAPKWWFFLLLWWENAHMRASMRYGSASPKTSTCPTLIPRQCSN